MSAMPRKQMKVLLLSLEAQGCRIRKVKSGYLVLFPNGIDTVTMHETLSDSRAVKNMRSRVRRFGLTWPFDK